MRGMNQDGATPYCRCRVKYIGSEVPHASKEGLLGVQEPLRKIYPENVAQLAEKGIDSWLSVWSNGLLLENVDERYQKVTRFFPIESLHFCAAVRHVKAGRGGDANVTRFFPLDSPFGRVPVDNHPPVFAAVLRRTTGIKVLECHAFVCKHDVSANALVRCCFHAHADNRFAKGLEPVGNGGASTPPNNNGQSSGSLYHTLGGSSTTLAEANGGSPTSKLDAGSNHDDDSSLYNGADENHKVWSRGRDEIEGLYQEQGTLRSTKGSRPRQMIAPPPPPPPPPVQPLMSEEASASSRKKPGKKVKKLKSKAALEEQHHHFAQHLQQMQSHHQAIYTNGHGHHTLGHPVRQRTPHGYVAHHQMPAPGSRSIAGTLARPAPLLLVPAATLPRKAHGHPPRGIRPIPAAAPIVPIYAPLPVVPAPPSAMYPGGYGTTGNRGRSRSHHHPADQMDSSTLGMQSRRMAASHADLSVPPPPVDGMILNHHHQRASADSPENESRFGTGIYRRKGHLNERAFSYSIRAEHRSRSHGSLASLGFAGVQQNGGGPIPNGLPPKEDKKTLEIAQMVAGLSFDDEGRNGHFKMNGYHPQPLPRPRPR